MELCILQLYLGYKLIKYELFSLQNKINFREIYRLNSYNNY